MSEKRDWGFLWHGLAVLAVAINAGFWIGREAIQQGGLLVGLGEMGTKSWTEALVPSFAGFVCMFLIVAMIDLARGRK